MRTKEEIEEEAAKIGMTRLERLMLEILLDIRERVKKV